MLDRARALGAVPKLFYVNNSSEYWNRAASLIATDPEGERDLPPAPEARIYHIAGAQHYVGGAARARHLRELRQHAQPLPRHARADGGVRALGARRCRAAAEHLSAHRRRHAGDGRRLQGDVPAHSRTSGCRRATCGRRASISAPRFETERIADIVPPVMGKPFEALVPKPDADGLDQGGIAPARDAGAARHPHRLQHPQRGRRAFPGPPAAGMARSCRSRAPRRSGRRRAIRGRPSRRAMPTAPPMRRRCGRPRPTSSARVSCCREDVDALVSEAGGLYDRIMAHDPADRSCRYMFDR